jgi:hypothetical protein
MTFRNVPVVADGSEHPEMCFRRLAAGISKKCRSRVATAVAVFGIVSIANAGIFQPAADPTSVLTWTLQDITFASGQGGFGSFSIDQGLGVLTDWNIQIVGGSDPVLTNISFLPGANCVVFCSELFDAAGIPSPSGLDVRTGLAPDNTFYELVLYFNAPLSEVIHPDTTAITVNMASAIYFELLVDPTTVQFLRGDHLSSTADNARVVTAPAPVPEPRSSFLFAVGLLCIAIATEQNRGRKSGTVTRVRTNGPDECHQP